jgi:hypothetical protein
MGRVASLAFATCFIVALVLTLDVGSLYGRESSSSQATTWTLIDTDKTQNTEGSAWTAWPFTTSRVRSRSRSSTSQSKAAATGTTTTTTLLEPVAAFEEWKQYHTREAILQNPHNRTFIVGTYSCPRLAGNMLVEFQNALQLAIVTNRTFLYQYRNAGMNSKGLNPQELCDTLLQRADWLPSFKEFKHKLHLSDPKTFQKETAHKKTKTEMFHMVDHMDKVHNDLSQKQVIQLAPWITSTSSVEELYTGAYNLKNRHAAAYFGQAFNLPNLYDSTIVQRLYAEGFSFLYGMLLQKTLPFTSQLLHQVQNETKIPDGVDPSTEISIAIHSRHNHDDDDGSDVSAETDCVQKILDLHYQQQQQWPYTNNSTTRGCALYIMSDRVPTVNGLVDFATNKTCRAVTVTHAQEETGSFVENGPFAGAGFFLDLALVTHARTGFVGMMRSSSALVDEIIEYQRRTEAWEATGKRLETTLSRCYYKDYK